MALPTRYIPFSIELAGVRWSGDWSLDGKELCVGSAYGSARRPLGRRRPDLLARDMLLDVLRAKVARADLAAA